MFCNFFLDFLFNLINTRDLQLWFCMAKQNKTKLNLHWKLTKTEFSLSLGNNTIHLAIHLPGYTG